ncbi:unnamed protein product [Staurois parvus]|uniref:Uncharacterized protein n=1 Tax=Staurois parvus TaxID=386267 RepID=A0ABN9GVA9_9NEOB|nr:unnamed protein product [Staurois parvus]
MLSCSKIFEWCKHFKDGRTYVSDDHGRSGSQPTTVIHVNIHRVEHPIMDNQCINLS